MEQKRGRGRQGGVSCKDGRRVQMSVSETRQSSCHGEVRCLAADFIALCTDTLALACHVKIETKTRPGSEV